MYKNHSFFISAEEMDSKQPIKSGIEDKESHSLNFTDEEKLKNLNSISNKSSDIENKSLIESDGIDTSNQKDPAMMMANDANVTSLEVIWDIDEKKMKQFHSDDVQQQKLK